MGRHKGSKNKPKVILEENKINNFVEEKKETDNNCVEVKVGDEKEIVVESGRTWFKEIANENSYEKIFQGSDKSAILIFSNEKGIYINGYYTRPFCYPVTNRLANLKEWLFLSWYEIEILKRRAKEREIDDY